MRDITERKHAEAANASTPNSSRRSSRFRPAVDLRAVCRRGAGAGGVPPLAGFWSKDAIDAATLVSPWRAVFAPLAIVGTALTATYVARMLRLLWRGEAEARTMPGLSWMGAGLLALAVLAVTLGLALRPLADLMGTELPESITSIVLGSLATAAGLIVGWFCPVARLLGPLRAWAETGFRVGNGWLDAAVRPALVLAAMGNALDRALHDVGPGAGRAVLDVAHGPAVTVDELLYAGSLATGDAGLALAWASRALDERGLDIDHGDVGSDRQCGGNNFVSPRELGDHLDIVFELQQPPHRGAKHRLVLGEQDADRRAPSARREAGVRPPRQTRRLNPRPSARPVSSVPPTAWIRSASPSMPAPGLPGPGPRPSSSIASEVTPSAVCRAIRQVRAPLCLTTFVTASRTAHAIVLSCAGSIRASFLRMVTWMPAVRSAASAAASSASRPGECAPVTASRTSRTA